MRTIDLSIIGGADGPTAIFVSSSVFEPYIVVAAIAIIGGVIAFFVKRLRKKK